MRHMRNNASFANLTKINPANNKRKGKDFLKQNLKYSLKSNLFLVSHSDDLSDPVQDIMPDFGLFEAAHIACPVLPQYHPKQLMELLNSGKIRWVKAILGKHYHFLKFENYFFLF